MGEGVSVQHTGTYFDLLQEKGGINFAPMVAQRSEHEGGLTAENVKQILAEYKIHHADVIVREDVNVDQLIDVVEGNRRYIPCVYVMNKIDAIRYLAKVFKTFLC